MSEGQTAGRTLRAAVVQDAASKEVLMLAWMDDEAEQRTVETGEAHFFSRSRRRLWHKGETSGNTLSVQSMQRDCDGDAVLIQVAPNGPACHTGTASCFTPWLWRRIAERESADPRESYVARLLSSGTAAVAQKVGEEAVEAVIAAVGEDRERLISEAADLWFHLLLLLRARGLDIAEVEEELLRRDRWGGGTGPEPAGEAV